MQIQPNLRMVTLYLPPSVVGWYEDMAAQNNVARSVLMRLALSQRVGQRLPLQLVPADAVDTGATP